MENYEYLNNIVNDINNWDNKLGVAPRTFEHFYFWINEYFGYYIPYSNCKPCKEHSYPLNAMWEAYAEITPMAIWYANRAGGKTYDLSVLSFMESIFKKKCGINILGGSLDQAQKAISYLTEFWGYPNAPTHLLIGNQVSKRGYQLTNGSWVRALAASSKSVRGSHQPKLRIDECLTEDTLIKTINGNKAIKEITNKDIVYGWNGVKIKKCMVQYNSYMGERKTYKIFFSNGNYINCTDNHKILTTKGYKYLHEIKRRKCKGETIFVIGERKKLFEVWEKIKFKKKIYNWLLSGLLYKIKCCTKKILPRLQKRDNKKFNNMQRLLCKKKKIKKTKMHRMRKRIKTCCKTMQEMLFKISFKSWYGFKNGKGKSDSIKEKSNKSRNTSIRIIRLFKDIIPNTNTIQQIYSRFFMQGFESNNRNTWRILAQQRKDNKIRQKEKGIFRKRRVQSFNIKNNINAFMVFRNYEIYKVIDIKEDKINKVYDLKIKDLKSFLANGIIVHNCDEVDKNIYLASLGQPQAMNGIPENIIISSTLHQPFGLMSEIVESKDDIGAKLFKWCVKEVQEPHGYWKTKDIELKKKQITKAMFDAEYLCLRPKIGDTIFDFESVDRSYRRGMKDKYNKKLYTEIGLDWGYAVTALSIIQDDKEKFTNPITKTFEYVELTDRCKEIADICIEYNVKIIYADSNPKDSNITLKKILKEKRCQTELITIAFNKWKDVGINVIRLLLEKDRLNITDKTAQEKMKKYHYKNPEQGIIAKEDDHICDSFIAWGSSRHKLLI